MSQNFTQLYDVQSLSNYLEYTLLFVQNYQTRKQRIYGFKNQTSPAGSTENIPKSDSILSKNWKYQKIRKKPKIIG